MKRQKLIPYGKLMKLAVQAFNGWVRRRDRACVICGAAKHLTAGHLITARVAATRFSDLNTNGQCRKCNFNHEHRPEIYTQWFIGHYGLVAYCDLIRQSMEVKKYTRAELHRIIEKYS